MIDAECKETYKECMASHAARYQQVYDKRQPSDTLQELADRAGCSLKTMKRIQAALLQKGTADPNCNKKQQSPLWTQEEIDACTGPPMSKEEKTQDDFLYLSMVALRITQLDLKNVTFTSEMRSATDKVIDAWVKIRNAAQASA